MADVIANIRTELGAASPALTDALLTLWVDDVRTQIRRRYDLATLDPILLEYVTRQAVLAKARNPDGASATEVSVDDGRLRVTPAVAGAGVIIWPELWELLRPLSTGETFSIVPG